jgi:hypothetical protein
LGLPLLPQAALPNYIQACEALSTDRALISAARLGFTTTYKTAGTAQNTRKSYKTSHVVAWIVGWINYEFRGNPHSHFLENRSSVRIIWGRGLENRFHSETIDAAIRGIHSSCTLSSVQITPLQPKFLLYQSFPQTCNHPNL